MFVTTTIIKKLLLRNNRRSFIKNMVAGFTAVNLSGCDFCKKPAKNPEGHFVLWQLPPQTHSQMNSYVLRTTGGKVIVIDGGCSGDASYLRGFLGSLGNHVDTWFISHTHLDHVDALIDILNNPYRLTIDTIYGSLPDEAWVEKNEPSACTTLKSLNVALAQSGHSCTELDLGQMLLIDGVKFEIIGIKNPELIMDADFSAINNQSVVMRVTDDSKSVLFTGDLGGGGGDKILNGPYKNKLRADYVQMSHHGQHGVYESFYQAVNPQYCLWPTPSWLWDNDNGKGKNSGPWLTLEVRAWMEKLNIRKHFVSADGLYRIE
jgi:beta-lactamase superfamily II metal-dependent hydrolase